MVAQLHEAEVHGQGTVRRYPSIERTTTRQHENMIRPPEWSPKKRLGIWIWMSLSPLLYHVSVFFFVNLPLAETFPSTGIARHPVKRYPSAPPLPVIKG